MKKIIYHQNTLLRSIIQQSFQLKELDLKIKALIGLPLAEHCHVANLENGCLHIQADSAAWSTNFVYQKEELLQKLRAQHYTHITQIKCSVRLMPALEKSAVLEPKPALLPDTIEYLQQTATSLSDQKLKTALNKLALSLGK